MNETRRCLYCRSLFLPSRHRPQQRVCSRPDCQRQRRTNSRRQKLATDLEYGQVVRDSRKKWWDEHPDYQKERRKANPGLVEKNRQEQHIRDQKRRLERLVRNNLVLDLKHSAAEVCLVGPYVHRLDRNNLVSAQVLILPSVVELSASPQLILTGTSLSLDLPGRLYTHNHERRTTMQLKFHQLDRRYEFLRSRNFCRQR